MPVQPLPHLLITASTDLYPAHGSRPPGFAALWHLSRLFLAFAWLLTVSSAALAESTGGLAASSDDYIVARAIWKDVDGKADFDFARQQAYTAYEGLLSKGYIDGAHWVRLTIAPSEEPLILRVGPIWLDELTLYDPAAKGAPVTLGDHHPYQRNALSGLGYSFRLPAHPVTRDIWLRVQSTSIHMLSAQAMMLDDASQALTRQLLWSSLYLAILLLSFFVLMVVWWAQRDRLLAAYLRRHAFYTYYSAAYLGLPTVMFADWLPSAFFDKAFSVSVIAVVAVSVPFDLAFLSSYKPPRFMLALVKAVGWVSVGVFLVLLAGHERLALQMNVNLLMVAIVIMAVTALSAKAEYSADQLMPKWVMVAYYLVIFSSLLIGLANMFGKVQGREWMQYAFIMHGLVSGLGMIGILFVRAQRMAGRSQQVTWELQQAKLEKELEQRRRYEQSQFLHMLMHELKTPLSVVSLALGTKTNREQNLLHAGHAVQDMKAIIDRCVQADQFGDMSLVTRRQPVSLNDLVRELGRAIPSLATRLRLSGPADLPDLQSDQQLVRIVVGNLLQNASRYSDPLTSVDVVVQPEERQGRAGLALRVANIPGLAGWPDQEQLFSKYYRASGALRESGSGLGLYLSRQLAQSLGGTLTYEPSSQRVEFVLWIPLFPA